MCLHLPFTIMALHPSWYSQALRASSSTSSLMEKVLHISNCSVYFFYRHTIVFHPFLWWWTVAEVMSPPPLFYLVGLGMN